LPVASTSFGRWQLGFFTPFFVDDPIFPGAAMLTQALMNKLPKTANFSNSPLPPNEFKKAIAGKQKAPSIFRLGAYFVTSLQSTLRSLRRLLPPT
jgi:hypothetical protein